MGAPIALVLPSDDVLSGLGLLLDADAVSARLRQAGHDLVGGELTYLKYKPRTSCVAGYEFGRAGSGRRAVYYGKCFRPSQFSLASDKVRRHRWTAPPSGPPVVVWPEARTLLYVFPNDAQLDGLRILARPRSLRRLVKAHLPAVRADRLETDLVRYKPERRAVFRSWSPAPAGGGGAEFYWRVYAGSEGPWVFWRMAGLASSVAGHGVRTPLPYDYDPERRLLAMEALPGRPLNEILEDERAVSDAADALARLHGAPVQGLTPRSAEDFLADAARVTEMLSCLSEDAGAQAARMLKALTRAKPAPARRPVFVHGDFHPGQVLVDERGVGVLDFDRSHAGTPVADAGAFLARLRLALIDGRVRDERPLACAFVDGYAGRSGPLPEGELRFWTALALLLLALEPFRRLDADWQAAVRRVLDSAEESLC